MRVFIISNMAPSAEMPHAGSFVLNQVEALQASCPSDWVINFIGMPRRFTGRLGSIFKYLVFILKVISRHFFVARYDIIHVHYFMPTIVIGLLYKLIRSPSTRLVVTFHGSDVYEHSNSSLYRFLLRRVDFAIAVSQRLGKRLIERGFPKSRLHVLSAGILPCFTRRKPESNKVFDLVFVGAFVPIKGFDLFLKLLVRLPPLHIMIIGKGAAKTVLALDQLAFHKIETRSSATPDELADIFQSSRFLVNMSRNESFGLVMTEAMAVGTPVLATATDGALEQIRDQENGVLIVGSSDSERLSAAYEVVSNALKLDQKDYNKMKSAAIQSADSFRLKQVVPKILTIYQDAVHLGQ